MSKSSRSHWLVLGMGICVFAAGQALAADVYQGTAKFKNAEGKQDTAKVTISLEGATPETERVAIRDKVQSSPQSAKSVLAGQKQLGYIEYGDRRVPIRYANVSSSLGGETVSIISDEPLGYIGGAKKNAKPKEGFDLTYVMFTMSASGKGKGEMSPACKVKWMKSGAPAPDRYGEQVVWFEDVTKVTQP